MEFGTDIHVGQRMNPNNLAPLQVKVSNYPIKYHNETKCDSDPHVFRRMDLNEYNVPLILNFTPSSVLILIWVFKYYG